MMIIVSLLQSLEIYGRNGNALHKVVESPSSSSVPSSSSLPLNAQKVNRKPAERKVVTEYLLLYKRMWKRYDEEPWAFIEKYDVEKESNGRSVAL
jgi:hypothetical protein